MITATGAATIAWTLAPTPTNVGITNSDGQVTFLIEYEQGICAPIPNSDPQVYEDFTSSVTAFLLIPTQITSDPLEILFVRTYQGP